MKATALIADDEPHLSRHLAERLAALWPELEILPPAANGIEALRAIDDHAPQVAFLDIRMPGLTGLELARRVDRRIHVVFVTAFDQYAVEAFEEDAVDYVLKPVTDERLAKCVARLKRKVAADEAPPPIGEVIERLSRIASSGAGHLRWVRALKGEVVHQIAVDDVLYFNASDKYTRVVTREGESLIRMPLADLGRELDPARFAQIHRSTIVNIDAVGSARRDLGGRTFVRLKDGKTELPVSRAYAHLFKQM
jgi:DNA-binding LytR/AlgR family response regulator